MGLNPGIKMGYREDDDTKRPLVQSFGLAKN